MNPLHKANQDRWNLAAANWKKMHDQRGEWKECHRNPDLVFNAKELEHLKDIHGKKVCVLGSGDNLAVFALAGMGAEVWSVDISYAQLDVAADRAKILGLDINFIQADVTELSDLENDFFDLVYTGGHVAVWVMDLQRYYQESLRILKQDGLFIVNEYHPFRRVWQKGIDELKIDYDYYDRGPFEFFYTDDILEIKEGDIPSYECHWTVSDLIQAILVAGGMLIDIDEFGDHVGDWEGAPLQGLPELLLLVARKK